jgi:hypothetical protein
MLFFINPAGSCAEHPFPNDVLAAVKRYGEHCKATYVLYEQFKDKRDDGDPIALSAHLADVKGKKVFEQANKWVSPSQPKSVIMSLSTLL